MLRAFSIWVLCLAVVGCGDDKASTAPSAVAEDAGVDAASEGSDAAMPPGDTGGEEPDVSSSDPDVAAPPSDTVGSNQETSAPGETCSEAVSYTHLRAHET